MTKNICLSAFLCGLLALPAATIAQPAQNPAQGEESMTPEQPVILSPREQARMEDEWLGERL